MKDNLLNLHSYFTNLKKDKGVFLDRALIFTLHIFFTLFIIYYFFLNSKPFSIGYTDFMAFYVAGELYDSSNIYQVYDAQLQEKRHFDLTINLINEINQKNGFTQQQNPTQDKLEYTLLFLNPIQVAQLSKILTLVDYLTAYRIVYILTFIVYGICFGLIFSIFNIKYKLPYYILFIMFGINVLVLQFCNILTIILYPVITLIAIKTIKQSKKFVGVLTTFLFLKPQLYLFVPMILAVSKNKLRFIIEASIGFTIMFVWTMLIDTSYYTKYLNFLHHIDIKQASGSATNQLSIFVYLTSLGRTNLQIYTFTVLSIAVLLGISLLLYKYKHKFAMPVLVAWIISIYTLLTIHVSITDGFILVIAYFLLLGSVRLYTGKYKTLAISMLIMLFFVLTFEALVTGHLLRTNIAANMLFTAFLFIPINAKKINQTLSTTGKI